MFEKETIHVVDDDIVRFLAGFNLKQIGVILSITFRSCVQRDQFHILVNLFVVFEYIHGKIWILSFEFSNLVQRDRKLYAGNIKVVQLLSIMRRSIRILDNWFSDVRKTVKEILGVFALDIHRCFLVLDIFRQRRIRRPSDHVEGGYIELTFQDTIETEPGPTTLMKVEQMFDTITSFVNLFMNIRTLKYYGRGRT